MEGGWFGARQSGVDGNLGGQPSNPHSSTAPFIPPDDKPRIARAVLTFAYYWYNFMPLARWG